MAIENKRKLGLIVSRAAGLKRARNRFWPKTAKFTFSRAVAPWFKDVPLCFVLTNADKAIFVYQSYCR